MKQVIYPLIATALVTITPFLLTFEKGQDIIRGLFSYSVFASLLLLIYFKSFRKKIKWPLMVIAAAAIFTISFIDLSNLLSLKKWNLGWFWLVPLVTTFGAVVIVNSAKKLSLLYIGLVLFLSLTVHLVALSVYPSQPLFHFPLIGYMFNRAPVAPNRSALPEWYSVRYNVTDSVKITKDYVDTSRGNVVILVESWGVPMDTNVLNSEINLFSKSLTKFGIHFRMYSRTRTAEREDLLDSAWRIGWGPRDSLFMPNRFASLGYETYFLFGGDSLFQRRYKYIRNIGFSQVVFTDRVTDDSVMVKKVDSLLHEGGKQKFVAWTTRDTRFPIEGNTDVVKKIYYDKLFQTLRLIASMAELHPDVRFIVQGDHEPILAPYEFMNGFYRRLVPYVVLN